jgi:hypothetical protein
MAKKFVVKTTTEYTYDEKGYVLKSVVTEESYETEIYTGGNITTGTITAKDIVVDKLRPDVLKKTTGILPNTGTVTSTYTGGETTVQNKTITEIANEVKAILNNDLKRTQINPTTFI